MVIQNSNIPGGEGGHSLYIVGYLYSDLKGMVFGMFSPF